MGAPSKLVLRNLWKIVSRWDSSGRITREKNHLLKLLRGVIFRERGQDTAP